MGKILCNSFSAKFCFCLSLCIFFSKFMDINNVNNNNNSHHHVPLSKNMQIHLRLMHIYGYVRACVSHVSINLCVWTIANIWIQSHPKQFQFHNINIVDVVVSCHCHNYFFFSILFFRFALCADFYWQKVLLHFFSAIFPYILHQIFRFEFATCANCYI